MSSDPITEALKAEGATAFSQAEQKTGRGGSGKLRNFKAMNDEKFFAVAAAVRAENNDPEALDAIANEMRTRR